MPPAFALSQDQTLRFISATRPKPHRADAFSIRLRSLLSMLFIRPAPPPASPLQDPTDSTPCVLASKRPMRFSKISASSTGLLTYNRHSRPKQGHPASLQEKRTTARRQADQNHRRSGSLPTDPAVGAVGVSGWRRGAEPASLRGAAYDASSTERQHPFSGKPHPGPPGTIPSATDALSMTSPPKKRAPPEGAAEFREETSKKAAGGEPLCCGAQIKPSTGKRKLRVVAIRHTRPAQVTDPPPGRGVNQPSAPARAWLSGAWRRGCGVNQPAAAVGGRRCGMGSAVARGAARSPPPPASPARPDRPPLLQRAHRGRRAGNS